MIATFDQLEQLAVGQYDIDIRLLYDLTPGELNNIIKGKAHKEEQIQRLEFERMRTICYYIAASSGATKAKSVDTFMPFPWDNKGKPYDEANDIINRVKELKNKFYNKHGNS